MQGDPQFFHEKSEKISFLFGKLTISFSSEGRKKKEVKNIVTCISIARQRVAKHIPATHVHATIEFLLLRNGAVNMPSQQ
jgi:hypothetical protein